MWAIIMLGGGHFAAAIYQGKFKPHPISKSVRPNCYLNVKL